MREKLFDRDVLAKLSRPEQEDQKQRKGIPFETKDYKFYGYMRRLKEKIESIWRYPPEAAERGIYGDLYIQFTIKKNGRLGAVDLVRTSGYKSLDDAAIRALREGEPFWPLPEDWNMDGLTITGHFVYTLHGFYLR
jgi:protein TonB